MSLSMSANNIANLSLVKTRHKVAIETTQLSRGEMFDRLFSIVASSLYKLVATRMSMQGQAVTAALESRTIINLVKRHMRAENIQVVDKEETPVFKRQMTMENDEDCAE